MSRAAPSTKTHSWQGLFCTGTTAWYRPPVYCYCYCYCESFSTSKGRLGAAGADGVPPSVSLILILSLMSLTRRRKNRPRVGGPAGAQPCGLRTFLLGRALPESDRTLRLAPLPGFALTAGAAGALVPREKSPAACGKRSGGMSAPPLMRWQSRQYGISSRNSWSGPSLPCCCWSASRSCQSLASMVERSIAHRRSRSWRFSRRSCSRSCSRCSRWSAFRSRVVFHSPPLTLRAPHRPTRSGRHSGHRTVPDPPS